MSAVSSGSSGPASTSPPARTLLSHQHTLEAPPEVARLLSLEGDTGLLRASSLTSLLRGGGALFSNSEGSDRTFELSSQAERIDYFLSHNWVTRRSHKFLALSLHFNFDIAVVVLVVWTGCLVGLGLAGKLPVQVAGERAEGWLGRLSQVPVFLFVLLVCRDVLSCFGHRGARLFLDKTCIEQKDAVKKALGITKLGAFIKRSEWMLVLYSPVYLKKIWTMYEMAAFSSLHPTSKMIVLPLNLGLALFFCILIGYAFVWVELLSLLWIGNDYLSLFLSANVFGIVLPIVVRLWTKQKFTMLESLSQFTLKDCTCFCEDDRPLVHRNIAVLMKAARVVRPDSTEEEALRALDAIVHSEVRLRFAASFGRFNFKWKHYATWGFLMNGKTVDGLALFGKGLASGRECLASTLYNLVFAFYVPLYVTAIELLMQRQVRLMGLRDAAYVAAVIMLAQLAGGILLSLSRYLHTAGLDGSDVAMVSLVLIQLSLFSIFTAIHWYCDVAHHDSIVAQPTGDNLEVVAFECYPRARVADDVPMDIELSRMPLQQVPA